VITAKTTLVMIVENPQHKRGARYTQCREESKIRASASFRVKSDSVLKPIIEIFLSKVI
jgi:hypothetical protein